MQPFPNLSVEFLADDARSHLGLAICESVGKALSPSPETLATLRDSGDPRGSLDALDTWISVADEETRRILAGLSPEALNNPEAIRQAFEEIDILAETLPNALQDSHYLRAHRRLSAALSFAGKIRYVAAERFAWPGGYALALLMQDGECLCGACVAENLDQILADTIGESRDESSEWCAQVAGITDDDDDSTMCAHCARPITDGTDLPTTEALADSLRDALADALADVRGERPAENQPEPSIAFLSSVNFPRDFARSRLADIFPSILADPEALAEALAESLGFSDQVSEALPLALAEPECLRTLNALRERLGLADTIGEGQAYSDPSRASDPWSLPDLEIFAVSEGEWFNLDNGDQTNDLAEALSLHYRYGERFAEALAESLGADDAEPLRNLEPSTLADIDALREAAEECYGEALAEALTDSVFAEALADAGIEPSEPGFYYQYCFPGCLPESEPFGPFASASEALADAREMA